MVIYLREAWGKTGEELPDSWKAGRGNIYKSMEEYIPLQKNNIQSGLNQFWFFYLSLCKHGFNRNVGMNDQIVLISLDKHECSVEWFLTHPILILGCQAVVLVEVSVLLRYSGWYPVSLSLKLRIHFLVSVTSKSTLLWGWARKSLKWKKNLVQDSFKLKVREARRNH